MTTPKTPGIWFPAKRYGWGWGPPVVWQGWAVLAGWVVILMGGVTMLMPENPIWHVLFALLMVAVLFVVCYVKGEPPRWRWGEK